MTLPQYVTKLNTLYITGNAREHSYRGDLQNLLMDILPDILVTNEPARVACGAPDYVLTRKDVPVGYIEAKDIGVDLNSKTLKEQFDRYRAGLNNLIFTDYMDFHLYKDGVLITKVAIAEVKDNKIVAKPEHFDLFIQLIKNFSQTVSQTIKSPAKLAEMMAGKAKLMADVIEKSLNDDDEHSRLSSLYQQMVSFKQMLIHDITNKGFADIYAQTIAYGMFAARYHDPTLPTFSRQEAATLIPKSNPFLRKLFQDIAGYDLDDRLIWIVDELVQIFLATDVSIIMKNFGKSTKQEDPVVHFYETFLACYNPALRKARGVWYTPQPVVNFIVRAVDDILKTEFGLKEGLADTSKIKVKVKAPKFDERSKNKSVITGEQTVEKEVHRVQILDPATGTGTFLAEVVRHIHKKFEGQQGIWSKYVKSDLIPRLNGFELLMASYAMAHLKMDMLLTETGYKPTDDQRFRIFLTNSLEEAHPDSQTLFSSWLSDEADQANAVKRDSPVMVVMGNPPYSVSSSNKSPWIESLTADYKKEMKERNIQPLSDDYIKFIRFGQHFIDKNGSGILAYISNNSFIDGLIHRQMRKHLSESFDKIYIIDLHGNTKKKEINPIGGVDENVFDIMQGVSINIFIKKKDDRKVLADIFHIDLFGRRALKYDILNENLISTLQWTKLNSSAPNFYFVNKNFLGKEIYESGFKLDNLFGTLASGLTTERDNLTIHFDEHSLNRIIEDFQNLESEEIRKKYDNKPDGRDWKISTAKNDLQKNVGRIVTISYRPFDLRKTYYTGRSKGFMAYPRNEVMQHLIASNSNIALIAKRGFDSERSAFGFVTKFIADRRGWSSPGMQGAESIFPLYLYTEKSAQETIDDVSTKVPNLNMQIVETFERNLGLHFKYEEPDYSKQTAESFELYPINILDYIYAVLHSPSYREKYKEFLKIDFPRVPYPTDAETFWRLVALGGELRQLHLLESETVEKYITQYPEDGDNIVTKPRFVVPRVDVILTQEAPPKVVIATKDVIPTQEDTRAPLEVAKQSHLRGKVFINDTQYFDNVPETVWNFYIGGYQPAQKWLKDRKGRELSYDDILHYQKMVVAMSETGRLMGEIDKVII